MRSCLKLFSYAAALTCMTAPAWADDIAVVTKAWCDQHKHDTPLIYPDCGHSTEISPSKIKIVHADAGTCSASSPAATITPKQLVICMAPLGLDGIFHGTPHSAGPVTYKTVLAANIAKRLNGKDGLTCVVQDADEGLIVCNSSAHTMDTPIDEKRLKKVLLEEATRYLEVLKRTCDRLSRVCKKETTDLSSMKGASLSVKKA